MITANIINNIYQIQIIYTKNNFTKQKKSWILSPAPFYIVILDVFYL